MPLNEMTQPRRPARIAMTVADVLERVSKIASMVTDPEGAHSEEDQLYIDVLEEIAAGNANGADLAKAALSTQGFDFERWCA